jgi:hypothetical protein
MRKLLTLLCLATLATGCVHAGVKGGGGSAGADGAVFIEYGLFMMYGLEAGRGSFSYDTANGEEQDRYTYVTPYVSLTVPLRSGTISEGPYIYANLGVPITANSQLGVSGELGIGKYFDSYFDSRLSLALGVKISHLNNMKHDLGEDDMTIGVGFISIGFATLVR